MVLGIAVEEEDSKIKMPRPRRHRRIGWNPDTTYFKPQGIPMRELEETILTLEETEALRLRYVEGFDQTKSAEKMHISQPTFQRILQNANQKLAEAIIKGKAIKILNTQ